MIEKVLEINSLLVVIFGGGIIATLGNIYNLWKKSIEARDAKDKSIDDRFRRLEKAQIATLHNKIYRQCTDHLEEGFISIDDLDDLTYMFDAYVSLGGNGTGEHLYMKTKGLPNRKGV